MTARIAFLGMLIISTLVGCAGKESEVQIGLANCGGRETCPDFQVLISDGLYDYDFIVNESNIKAGPFTTRSSGTLRINIIILVGGDETETKGAIELPLKKDWRWGIDIFIQQNDPIDVCFGCFGSKSYALDTVLGYDENERFFIVWGGNSISDPVVY